MSAFVVVFLGAGFGGVLRYLVTLATLSLFGPSFPVGTFVVNIVGSLLMGGVSECLLARGGSDILLRLFVVTGVLGGFTTFSAFSFDIVALHQRGETTGALLYGLSSVLLSIVALVGGVALARFFLGSSHPL